MRPTLDALARTLADIGLEVRAALGHVGGAADRRVVRTEGGDDVFGVDERADVVILDALNQPLEIGGWQPQGVAKEALEGLVRNLQGLADVVIRFFVGTLPLLLVIFIPLYIVLRIFLRLTKRPRRDTPTPPPAA